nr:hypothetical protein [Flavobacterium sp.]
MARIKPKDHIFLMVFGMFATTILASIWAIFGRINVEFQLFLTALQCFIIVVFKKEWYAVYESFWNQIKSLAGKLKIIFGVILLFTLIHSVSNSNFIDNETYYIQTIQWLNEYGFVKGLANLHLFLAQTSGWHILQSAFSFSYVSNHWNHLNGFCLLLGNLFAIFQLNDYFKTRNRWHLWIGLLPIMNVVLFPFCSVPSPDLAVIMLSLLLFYYFIKQRDENEMETINVLFIIAVFIIYIKITALPLMLLPLLYLGMHFKKMNAKITLSLVVGLLVFIVFIIKNTILTGYPLFPSLLFKNYSHVDYSIPISFYDFSFNQMKCYDFFISSKDYAQSNAFQIFLKWMNSSVYNGFIVTLMVLIPYFLKRFFNQKNYWILYGTMVLQFLFLWCTSPQYRFMIPSVLLFGLMLLSVFMNDEKTFYIALFSSFILVFFFLILPPKFGQHQQKLTFNKQSFSLNRLIYPNENSNLKTKYQQNTIGNLHYFSPDSTVYIWATGDGRLPCVNTKQIEYFKKKLHYIPQPRTSEIQDGFYAQKTP